MKKMWKTYIQGMIDFGSQVWCPVATTQISNLESVLRHLTERINGLEDLDYWSRLSNLRMYSQQRRFERYRVIYIWKVITGNVPNYGLKFSENNRRGLMVDIPTLKSKVKDSVKTIRNQSLTYF